MLIVGIGLLILKKFKTVDALLFKKLKYLKKIKIDTLDTMLIIKNNFRLRPKDFSIIIPAT